ncbi:MAG: hypothetical protein ACREOO_29875 [bacterium]
MDSSNLNGTQNGAFHKTSKVSQAQPSPKPASEKLTRDRISLEALINVMVQQGFCTEEQLLAEEARLRTVHRTVSNLHFRPVRVSSVPGEKQRKHPIKKWAAERRWARRLGAFLFGWQWRKFKKKERSVSSGQNPSRAK